MNETQDIQDTSGGPPRPERLSRAVSLEQWDAIGDPSVKQAIASAIGSIDTSQSEHVRRLHDKIDALAERGERDAAPAKNGSELSAIDTKTLRGKKLKLVQLISLKNSNPEAKELEGIPDELLSWESVQAIDDELIGRAAREATGGLRAEIAGGQHTSGLLQEVISEVGSKAVYDKNHPVHQRMLQHKEKLLAELPPTLDKGARKALEATLEAQAFRLAHYELRGRSRDAGGEESQVTSGLRPRQAQPEQDPKVASLMRQGKRRQAHKLRLRNWLTDSPTLSSRHAD